MFAKLLEKYFFRLRKPIKRYEYAFVIFRISDYLLSKPTKGVMAKVLDCGLEVSEFELQSRYNVFFRTNTHWKSLNRPYTSVID